MGAILVLLLSVSCGRTSAPDEAPPPERSAAPDRFEADVGRGGDATLPPESLEAGRLDAGWRRWVQADAPPAPAVKVAETFEGITAEATNAAEVPAGLAGDVAGPSVLKVQILLDRAWFSPGVIDGRWGKNTEKALWWFERQQGLPADGIVDPQVLARLVEAAGRPAQVVEAHTLSEDDVAGPFVDLPDDPAEREGLPCQCYESLSEKLAERFHATPALLARLNPGVDLDAVRAGDTLHVPAVTTSGPEPAGPVTEAVVSAGGHHVHALGPDGRILMHYPSTLGSTFSPSPQGRLEIVGVYRDPWWHYQPALLEGVPDDRPDAHLPPGPNNAVGVVWIELSKEHYGIHGTSAPETIGYATSSGCVRLTNWDAVELAERVREGVGVRFVDGG